MDDELSCARCQRRIAPRRDYVFRLDGGVEHVKCPASARKSTAPSGSEPAPDPICPACSAPIRSVESVVKDGADFLHIFCFVQRRPIAGGNVLPAWTPVGDEHFGRRLGLTSAGHQEFIAACVEARARSRQVAVAAERAIVASRARRASVGGIARPAAG